MLKNVNNTTFPSLLDLIAPHSCRGCGRIGKALCDRCKKNTIESCSCLCPFCKTTVTNCTYENHPLFPPTQIVSWRNSLTGKLVQDLKYHSDRSAAKPLAEILYCSLRLNFTHLFIVPLPTISQHVRQRGLDHTLLIAKHLAKFYRPNAEVARLLIRINTTTQVGSTRQQRLEQAQNAYKINPKIKIKKDATYLLLDDVWTTGASMTAAAKILQQNGINNIAIAVLCLSD